MTSSWVAISQTTHSTAFSWLKTFVFWFEFHWSLFLRAQKATSHYLNQCLHSSLTHICGIRGRRVNFGNRVDTIILLTYFAVFPSFWFCTDSTPDDTDVVEERYVVRFEIRWVSDEYPILKSESQIVKAFKGKRSVEWLLWAMVCLVEHCKKYMQFMTDWLIFFISSLLTSAGQKIKPKKPQ